RQNSRIPRQARSQSHARANGAPPHRGSPRTGDDARRSRRDVGNQRRDTMAKAPEIRTGLDDKAPARSETERAGVQTKRCERLLFHCAFETAVTLYARAQAGERIRPVVFDAIG